MKRPCDYSESSMAGRYPLDIHRVGVDSELGDGPMPSGIPSTLWYTQREAYARGNLYDLGLHGYQSRDRIASSSASHTNHGCRPPGDLIPVPGSSVVSHSADGGECSSELLRKLRESVSVGDPLRTCPVDQCKIMHDSLTGKGEEHFKYQVHSSGIPFASLSKSLSTDKGKEPLFASMMKESPSSPQSRTNLSMQEYSLHTIIDGPWKRKHPNNGSIVADERRMTLNANCSDYDYPWRQTGRTAEGDPPYKNLNMEPLLHYQGRLLEGHSSHRFSGSDDRHDNMHQQSSEPWMSTTSKGLLDRTYGGYMTDYGWRDGRSVADTDPDFPKYSKTRRFCYDNSQGILASGLLTGGESELMHRRQPQTYTSQFRTNGRVGSLGGTDNDYFTRFQEREMGDDQWQVDSRYNNHSRVEDYSKMRTFTDDSLHKLADGKSVYIHNYPSETWETRTSSGKCKRAGTDNDYYTSICEKEMNGNGWREQRRFDSSYETYPDAEPSRTLKVRPRHDSTSHRVSTSCPPIDNRSDYMHAHQSERSAFSNRQHSPLKLNRYNAQFDRDSVEKFEKEKDSQDKNVFNNLRRPCNGQSTEHAALLDHSESIQQSELNENSEKFKQRVHTAYLRLSKLLNENSEQKKRYQVQGKSGSLVCIVCGRHSKDYVDAHSLAMHTHDFQKPDLLAEHRGLYKALCVFLGWNQDVPPDNTRSYQSLSLIEARSNQENLILWPPLVIIQNARIEQGKHGQWEGIGNPEMDELLKELGFGSGKSKALYGKEGHKGIILVKFSSSFAGLQEAERLHKYFEGYCRGRKDWLRLQSLHKEKEINDEGPDFVRIDKETKKKKRVLYGYMGTAEDLGILDFDSRKRVLVKSRKDVEKSMKDQ